jgi:hypothetical protein
MRRGSGVAVRRTVGEHVDQAVAADLISVAGHSLRLHQTPLEGRYSLTSCVENSGLHKNHALETLLCPHPGLLNTAGCVRRHSQLVPDSSEGQPRDTW